MAHVVKHIEKFLEFANSCPALPTAACLFTTLREKVSILHFFNVLVYFKFKM